MLRERGSDARAWLGLARAAGKLAMGHWQCQQALARKDAVLVVIAGDASDATRRRFEASARRAGCRWVVWGRQDELGEAIGASPKAVVAFLDGGLASGFIRAVSVGPRVLRGRQPGRSDGR